MVANEPEHHESTCTAEQVQAALRRCLEACADITWGTEDPLRLATPEEIEESREKATPQERAEQALREMVLMLADDAAHGESVHSLSALRGLLLTVACIGHWTADPWLLQVAALAGHAVDEADALAPRWGETDAAFCAPSAAQRYLDDTRDALRAAFLCMAARLPVGSEQTGGLEWIVGHLASDLASGRLAATNDELMGWLDRMRSLVRQPEPRLQAAGRIATEAFENILCNWPARPGHSDEPAQHREPAGPPDTELPF